MIVIKNMLMKKRLYSGLLFIIVFFPIMGSSENLTRTTIVATMGTGAILNEDDAANARDRAISDSLISAIENILSGLLPVESLVANFKTLNSILYAYKDSLIQDYKVLTEEKYNKYYRVMVQATVSVNKLQQLLLESGIVIDRKTMPGILFLISEENLEDIASQYWWGSGMKDIITSTELALSETLQKKGFSVINHKTMDAKNFEGDTAAAYGAVLDHQAAMELASKYQADVVIIGTAQAIRASNTMGNDIKSFIGKISLQVYRTDTGTEIARDEKTAVSVDVNEISGGRAALTKVGVLAGEDIAPMVLSGWRKSDKKPTEIIVTVAGTNYLSNFVVFRETMKKIPGVKGSQVKEMESDKTVLIVQYQGDGKELANALLLNTFDNFGLNISLVSQSAIKIELIQAAR
ncbi:MAG: hypothetical protein KJ737_08075 [Proteobacteria bacterium]|nr:hypothetical protein [Pseudomonadota bacterium]